jgi:hypothetical protein
MFSVCVTCMFIVPLYKLILGLPDISSVKKMRELCVSWIRELFKQVEPGCIVHGRFIATDPSSNTQQLYAGNYKLFRLLVGREAAALPETRVSESYMCQASPI